MRRFDLTPAQPVSVICLGTAGLGTALDRDQSFRLLDRFVELGGNFVDSAHVYADWMPNGAGASERTIGAWLKSRGGRDRVVIGTKGAHPPGGTYRSRMTPQDIAQDLAESLERLGVETIDCYWLHRDDAAVPVGEILAWLGVHLTAGRVRAIAASNWSVERLRAAAEYATAHGLVGFCASQIGWSLAQTLPAYNPDSGMHWMDEGETLRFHRAGRLPVVAFSSQAQGFFIKAATRFDSVAPGYRSEENRRRLERAQTLGRRLGHDANAIALAYLTSQPMGVSAIIGPRTVEQLEQSCAMRDLRLSDDDVAYLDGIA
jgi:aryl-alcohol dehydrogenase-like predicted oxidoreductase